MVAIAAGVLLLAGGGTTPDEVVERFLHEIGGKNQRIVVLGQTREDPKRAQSSVELLKEHGATNVSLCDSTTFDRHSLKALEQDWASVRGFWVPGGDQEQFMTRFGRRWARSYFQRRLSEGVVFFGTSAGSMICSDTMIAYSDHAGAPVLQQGLGLTRLMIDTHYRERKRHSRLKSAFEQTLSASGAVGIETGEWVVISGDRVIESHGTPEVFTR
ncbi:MAG: Type 1 glutamine amidotransferase-like domain-containing protein [Chthonomonas sp.]|nr:Type 1 glutamine amidotransferase-like domain-containing protein [Chthonomonas sp.]